MLLGGPHGELGAATRYLSQRYAMPYGEVAGILTDVGTEELAHVEMISAILYQLTRNLPVSEIKKSGFDAYFVDHTTGIYPQAASGYPFNAAELASTGDVLADLFEDLAAEQKARLSYDNILRLVDDPDVKDTIRFLRERELVHFQRFGEAVRIGAKMSGGEFPIEVFPIRIQRIISSLHDCQGYPVDYVAAAILAAIAVGIGNSHLVQVKRNWLESPILYMALIGRPGANKSHPLSFAFQPFIEHDYCQNQEYQKLYAEYERTMSMSKKERMEAGLDEFPQAPVRRRFLVSDITPEGLSLIHAQNPRGLCLWSDELSAWFKNFNRYNNGSEEQFWLSVFNAKPTISDRKSMQSSIFIRRPYISVIGTIQKKILGELVKGERSSNGFIDRILFVMPESVLKSRWNDRETPEELEIQWQQIIDKLIAQDCPRDENNELQPQCLPFDEDAKQRLYGWQHENARQCDMETNDALVGIYCKLEIYIIRFCLIIQLARWTCGECDKHTIDLESVNRAILLAEYFRTTAVKVQTAVSQEQLSELHRNIYLNLPQRFTTAEGIGIAESYGMKEHAFKMFLKRHIGTLFRKENHGEYSK